MRDVNLRNEIAKMLIMFKVPTELAGFDYLKEGIYLCLVDENLLDGYTKNLYPILAEKFDTSGLLVERNIRSAITSAYNAGGLLGFNEIFDKIVYDNKEKLTSSEFISMLVAVIKLREMKREYKYQLLHEGDVPNLQEEPIEAE